MIRVAFSSPADGSFRLRLRGHAGAGAPGQDLVCAGASTLAHTLTGVVELLNEAGMLEEKPVCTLQPGFAHIIARPREEYWQIAAIAFWAAQVGFATLAQSYPENVTVERVMKVGEGACLS